MMEKTKLETEVFSFVDKVFDRITKINLVELVKLGICALILYAVLTMVFSLVLSNQLILIAALIVGLIFVMKRK